MWYSNDAFHYYTFKAEFVTLVSLKVPSGDATFKNIQIAHSMYVQPECSCTFATFMQLKFAS